MAAKMDENNNLRAEIARLNKIITVLLDQISVLKAENNALKNERGIKNIFDTVPDYDKDIKENIDTDVISEKGIEENIDTDVTSRKGVKENIDTDATSEKGIKESIDTVATIGKGIKENFNTTAANSSAAKTDIGNAAVYLPAHIEADNTNVVKLAKALRNFLPDTRQHDALSNIARELLLLHNATRATSHELRKEAGLSKPGFAKHLPKLKRRGFIMSEPPLKYRLTEMSREIMEKVFG